MYPRTDSCHSGQTREILHFTYLCRAMMIILLCVVRWATGEPPYLILCSIEIAV